MATDKEPFEGLTTAAQQTAKQITEQTQGAMQNYFGWLQTTMSAFPWSNTNLPLLRSCKNLAKPRIFKTLRKFKPSLCRCK